MLLLIPLRPAQPARAAHGSVGMLEVVTEGNALYYDDNLDVPCRHMRDESVDLV